MRRPNLNSLRMFDAAARHLNFRLASEELNLTQGAVAQQVRRLEADLGYQLFQRQAHGLALTEIGRGYHTSIRRALSIIDDATRKLRPDNTRIRLSVTPPFASKWLVSRLSAFADLHPDIEVQIVANEARANFQSDGIDIAIRQGQPPFGGGLDETLLAPLELRAVCSPELAELIGPITDLEDFAAQVLIQDGHNLWDRLFEEETIRNRGRMMQFNQTALAMDAAANGQGIALAPRLLVTAEIAQGRLVELWEDSRPGQGGYYIVRPGSRKSNAATDAFTDWILLEVARFGVEN